MSTGTVVVRRSLGRRLKQLRNAAHKTVADVVTAGICSKAKLARIESGATAFKVPDVQSLCLLYGADQATMDALVAMARNTSQEGWWEDYNDVVAPWFATYVELESAASSIVCYDPELVFGLLQTPDYTRAVCAADPRMGPDAVERTVGLRAQRQRAAFDRTPPLTLTVILGAGVLAREVGGPKVMGQQRDRLLDAARQPNINLRVLPWSAGAHAAMQGAFEIVEFDTADHPDVVYLETRVGGRLITKEGPVEDYRRISAAILSHSQPIEEHLR